MASAVSTLTQFPNLYHTNVGTSASSESIAISLQPRLPDEAILLAWALILEGYTGEELPAFLLNNAQAVVDTRSGAVKQVNGAETGLRSTRVTLRDCASSDGHEQLLPSSGSDVACGEASTSAQQYETNNSTGLVSPALDLIYVRETGSGYLRSRNVFPLGFLQEFAHQLHSCIHRLSSYSASLETKDNWSIKQSILNPHPVKLEGSQLLHELLYEKAARNEIAVDFKNKDATQTILSYDALRQKSFTFTKKLQRCFRDLGQSAWFVKHRFVPVLIPQSPDLFIALLGILGAGLGFCPLSMDTPEDRIKFIFQDLGAQVAVCMSCDISKFTHITDITFCTIDGPSSLDNDESIVSDTTVNHHWENDEQGVKPQDPAYVMYTSGSTGQPKGVMISHLAVTQSLLAHDPHIPNYSRFLQFASPTFDVSMFEIFFTFFRGSTLVGCNRAELLNNLPEIISELNIDAAELTPTVAGTLIRKREDAPNLKLLLTIGEMLTKSVVEEFGFSENQAGILYGMYGPTEAAIHCTLQPKFSINEKVGLIGHPLKTVSAFIARPLRGKSPLDSLEILPIGHVGELVVGGPQLADGYLNRSEQTRKAFFESLEYGMLYRTGDKARLLPNGIIECLGRIQSGQIKLRGQRIELGEIEQAAMLVSACRLAVASVIRDQLVLFCLSEGNLIPKAIEEACRKWLLSHMIPNEVIVRTYFPQLPSGKVDKKALEVSYEADWKDESDMTESNTDSESAHELCGLVEEILNIKITPQTDLIRAGLDSIRAIRLASEIRRQKLCNASAVDILRSGSVNALCQKLERMVLPPDMTEEQNERFVRFRNLGFKNLEEPDIPHVQDILPCTPLQASMLVETMKDSKAYHNQIEISVDSSCEADSVLIALNHLFQNNEVLRSGFAAVEDPSVGFVQVIWKERADYQLINIVNGLKQSSGPAGALDLLRPIRVAVSQGPQEIKISIHIHHAIYDGWSLDLLLKDLDNALDGLPINKRPGFSGVIDYYTRVAKSSDLDTSRDYWERLLKHVKPAGFPDFRLASKTCDLPLAVTYEIPLKSAEFYVNDRFHPQVYIQTALVYLWATYLGSNDVVLGTVSSGRTIPVDDIEKILGPCIATLPLRVKSVCSQPLENVMLNIQEQNRSGLEHGSVSLRDIKKLADLSPPQTLFEVVFVWQESVETHHSPTKHINHVTSYDFLESKLFIEAEPHPEFVRLKCSQREQVLPEPQTLILLQQIGEIAQFIIKSVNEKTLEIPLSSIGCVLSDKLRSTIDSSGGKSAKVGKRSRHASKPVTSISTIVSHPYLSSEQYVLPIGGIGILASWNGDHSPERELGLLNDSSHQSSKSAGLDEMRDICRVLPDTGLEILGKMRDFRMVNNQLMNISSLTSSMRDFHSVTDCRTLVISKDSNDLIVALWIPDELKSLPHEAQLPKDQMHFLSATKSYVETSKSIFDYLCSKLPQNVLPTYILPADAVSIHELTDTRLTMLFHSLSGKEYLNYFECYRYDDDDLLIRDKITIEHALIHCLSEVLEVDLAAIDRTTSFFKLGLDSITAISFSRKVDRLHGLKANVSAIFKHSTISKLASYLLTTEGKNLLESTKSAAPQLTVEIMSEVRQTYEGQGFTVDKIFQCTPLQEGMLASSTVNAYKNHTLFEIFLPGSQFRSAFTLMCQRHEILRTLFASTRDLDFPFVQVVLSESSLPWREVSYEESNIELILSEQTNFDIDALDSMKLPFLVTEIIASPNTYLLLSVHHALYDGEAMSQLLCEVEKLIRGNPLPDTISYDRFLNEALYRSFNKVDEFWLNAFAGFQPVTLSPKPHIVVEESQNKCKQHLVLSTTFERSLATLEHAARDQAAPLSAICQATWSKILAVMLNAADVCFGNVLNGRSIAVDGIERLVAPCFNTIPIRAQAHRGRSNQEIIQTIQNTNAESFAYQFTPLRRIHSLLGFTGTRFFDSLLLIQKPSARLDETIWAIKKDIGDMGLPLICEIIPDIEFDQLRIDFHVDASYIPVEKCEELSKAFNSALTSCIQNPQADCMDFNLHGLEKWSTNANTLIVNRRLNESAKQEIEIDHDIHAEDSLVIMVRDLLSEFTKLPLSEIRPERSIFRLGLDSISAIQIAKQIRQQGFNVSSQDIMNGKSAIGISKIIQEHTQHRHLIPEDAHFDLSGFDEKNRSALSEKYMIDIAKIYKIRPCTQPQAGILSQYLSSNGQKYLNHFLLELDSGVDIDKLQVAWQSVMTKHDMLRTGFAAVDSAKYPFLMISYEHDALELPWVRIDLIGSESSSQDWEKSLSDVRNDLSKQFFQNLHLPSWNLTLLVRQSENQLQCYLNFSALHALYDAESLKLIFHEVTNFYRRNGGHYANNIEPLLCHILRTVDEETKHREYWRSNLENAPLNKFPNLNPVKIENEKTESLSVRSRNLSLLEEGCRLHGVTIQAALQVSWARLLAEYVGEEDVLFGVVFSGRESYSADEIIFPSSTTVPCRTIIRTNNTQMLQEAMNYNISVRQFQHASIPQIARWAGHTDSSLFDTILVFQPMGWENSGEGIWKIKDEQATVEYPISIEIIRDNDEELVFRLVYSNIVLPKEHGDLLLHQFMAMVDQTITGKHALYGTPYDSLNLLSLLPPKVTEIASRFETLHTLVEDSAIAHPDKIALEFVPDLDKSEVLQWTYAELNLEGNKIANKIIQQGIKQGSLIAVCFEKCAAAAFTLLGILKAGCAFVAIDPLAPDARKSFILDDSEASMLVTTSNLAKDMNLTTNMGILCVDALDFKRLNSSQPELIQAPQGHDPCYCLYTSGSSGTPKGCIITHENSVQAMLAFQNIFAGRWDSSSRWLQFASLHFDVSVLEHFWSWSVGICVVITPRDVLFADLPGALTQLKITHIDLTPSLARLITPKDVPSLCRGIFITGGEPLKQEVLDAWGSSGVIHNGYGPTECTIGCTMYPGVPSNGKPSNIGWQFENVGTYVFKVGTTQLVPRGAIGELCVSGKLVGKGYLNRPDLTTESFMRLDAYGEEVYRTKDLVRMLYDGSFDFVGRNDDQVKLRGQRLELGEINNAISCGHPDVQEATTIVVRSGSNQSEQLVTFITLHQEMLNGSEHHLFEKIRSLCQETLPNYMVPTHFMLLDKLPLTANNKSDVKRLRELFDQHMTKRPMVALDTKEKGTVSEEDESVLQIVADFFSVSRDIVVPTSNLFEFGLDSISAFGLARAFQREGFEGANSASILNNRTVNGLIKALKLLPSSDDSILQARYRILAFQRKHETAISRTVKSFGLQFDSAFPCTPLQHGMIAKALQSDSCMYFNSLLFEVNIDALQNMPQPQQDLILPVYRAELCDCDEITSLKCLSRRLSSAFKIAAKSIPILRTVFVPTQDGYSQVVIRDMHEKFCVTAEISATDNMQHVVHKYRSAWLKENTEIFSCPTRVCILRNEHSKKIFMVLNMFHGVYDATSLLLLLETVKDQLLVSEPNKNTPSFFDALEHCQLRRPAGAAEFWKMHLQSATFRSLQTKNHEPSLQSHVMSSNIKNLTKLESVRRRLNVTHQAVIQAVWIAVFQEWSNHPSTIGLVVSGRSINLPDADKILGPMFNTIPFSLRISDRDTWASLVWKCHDFNMSALPFQHTALRDIQKLYKTPNSNALFDSLFVFQKDPQESTISTRRFFTPVETTVQSDYPLAFEAEHIDHDTMKISIAVQHHIADSNTCSSLLHQFEHVLKNLLDEPEETVAATINLSDFSRDEDSLNKENGINGHQSHEVTNFHWTNETTLIREKLAMLSGMEVDCINEQTSIYQLGLDSIDAIKLSSSMKSHGLNLSVSSILRQQSILRMSEILGPASTAKTSRTCAAAGFLDPEFQGKLEQFQSENCKKVLPSTPLQEAIISEMISSNFSNYYNHDVLRLNSYTDIDRLKDAWETLFKNRDILRTIFHETNDPDLPYSFVQAIQSQIKLPWYTIEGAQLDGTRGITGIIEDIIGKINRNQRLEIDKNSLIKLTFVVDEIGTRFLVLSMSHALYDGWSLNLLHQDILAAYHGKIVSRPAYVGILNNILQGQNDEAKEFWADSLSGFTGCRFPLTENVYGMVHRFERGSDTLMVDIREFCKAQNVGLQALGHFCWAMVLAAHTKSFDVGFGVVLSGREDVEAQQVMFPTMNTVLVRHIVAGSRSEMLKEAQSNLGNVLCHQHFPLRSISALAGMAGHELFNTLFIYQRRPENTSEHKQLYESIDSSSHVEYPVCVEMEVIGEQLVWRNACSNASLSQTASETLLEELDQALKSVMTAPEAASIDFRENEISVCGLRPFPAESQVHLKRPDAENVLVTNGGLSLDFGYEGRDEFYEVEGIIRETLSIVSKTPTNQMSEQDTIYHLGLDSISLIKVASILKQKAISVSVGEMLKAGTVKEIVRAAAQSKIQDQHKEVDISGALSRALEHVNTGKLLLQAGIKREEVERIVPATPAQVFFVTQCRNTKGTIFYPRFEYEIKGQLELEELQEAWRALVQRNPVLRTILAFTGDRRLPMIQVIAKPLDDSGKISCQQPAEIDDRGVAVPMVRMQAKQPHSGCIRVWLEIHHAFYDAVSLPLLIQQLEGLCKNEKTGTRGGETGAFADYVGLAHLAEVQSRRQAFWTEYLRLNKSGLMQSKCEMELSFRTSVYRAGIVKDIEGLMYALKRKGLGIQALFVAIAGLVYSHQCVGHVQEKRGKEEDVVLGVYLANRSHDMPQSRDLTGLAAPTVNVVPVLVESPQSRSIFACASQVQEHLHRVSSFENATVGLWEIDEWTGVKIDCFVNFLSFPNETAVEPDEKKEILEGADSREVAITRVEENERSQEGVGMHMCMGDAIGNNAVQESFVPSWDIEAAVREGGLDVGVFGPLAILSQQQAKSVVEELKLELDKALNG